jgi:hypothetical protein
VNPSISAYGKPEKWTSVSHWLKEVKVKKGDKKAAAKVGQWSSTAG